MDSEICTEVSREQLNHGQIVNYQNHLEIWKVFNHFYFLKNLQNGEYKIISKLEAPKTNQFKKYLQGTVIHEEAIDTCKEFRKQGMTSDFYYLLLKSKISILSDYKHLWKSLSKKEQIKIHIFKDEKIVSEDYDLIGDELNVWNSNRFLILATTEKTISELKNNSFLGKILEEEFEGKSNKIRVK